MPSLSAPLQPLPGAVLSLLVWARVGLAAPVSPPEQDHVQVQALYDALRFEDAERAVAEALERPGRDRAELAELYRLRGLIHAARDDNAGARRDFSRWLALSPGAKLPAGVAPKILAPFTAAQRDQRHLPPLGLGTWLLPGGAGRAPLLRLQVRGDRTRLSQAVLLWYAAGPDGGTLRLPVPPRRPNGTAEVQLPLGSLGRGGGELRYLALLLGEHGGRLDQAGTLAAPLGGPLYERPWYRRGWFWGTLIGAGVATGAGLGLGLGLGLRR